MARLEQVITSIVDMFVEYADDNGKNHKLNKDEFKMLLEKEIQNPEIKAEVSAADFDKVMGRLDKNHDGEVNFKEFCKGVAFMAMCYYRKKTSKVEGEEED
ncbi:protein S100-A6-like [Thunnus albacares]|uniref:protein S100-A6-like n=1 Tax=Thunnus maccoyii TaxID=8240 RepID=UPI001C4CC263|nr:protein S100-A6-like [Thunnus maccoyii]XP_044215668.1 protein S100-A6-like [Thunnus albacares]